MKGFKESNKKKLDKINENNLALYTQAVNLQKKGELNKAAQIYRQLIKNKYFDENVFLNYASICQHQKKSSDAILLLKESIKINPKNFIPFFKMGFILNNKGSYYEAYPFAKKAIELNPNLWEGYHNLIKILRNLKRPVDAAKYAETAVNLFSSNHLFNGLLGNIYSDTGDFKKAAYHYKRAISKAPKDDETIYSFANFLIGTGNKKEGMDYLNQTLKVNPYHAISYYSLSTIIDVKKEKELKEKILNLDIQNFKKIEDNYTILFSKAHIFHKLKEYDKSANFLKKANDLKLLDRPSNLNEIIELSETIKNKTSLENTFDKPKFKFLRDIFIVGLPRSGSTLVESILGMNKEVHNLGESSILLNALIESERSNFSEVDRNYLKYSQYFSSKKITTNKMLSNYLHIPHIISKLEHSKVIYTFRNPLDNILSMYKAKFTGIGNEYSSSLVDSALYYIHHFKIMSFYRNKYKEYIYFLNYEKLVNNPTEEIKKLLDWLGFIWDENYLKPYKNKQGFFTASNVQVRSPINNKSVGGWRKYSNLLSQSLQVFKKNNFALDSFEKFDLD